MHALPLDQVLGGPAPRVVVDLSGVVFCDSTGLSAFLGLLRRARETALKQEIEPEVLSEAHMKASTKSSVRMERLPVRIESNRPKIAEGRRMTIIRR